MLQFLQIFAKFQKIQVDNLVDFEKCCKTHILNYFLAKIGADTAENERNFAENLPKIGNYPTAAARPAVAACNLVPQLFPLPSALGFPQLFSTAWQAGLEVRHPCTR